MNLERGAVRRDGSSCCFAGSWVALVRRSMFDPSKPGPPPVSKRIAAKSLSLTCDFAALPGLLGIFD